MAIKYVFYAIIKHLNKHCKKFEADKVFNGLPEGFYRWFKVEAREIPCQYIYEKWFETCNKES